MPRKTDFPRLIVDHALELAAAQGWANTSLSDIAEAAGLTLAQLRATFPSKTAIIAADPPMNPLIIIVVISIFIPFIPIVRELE